MKTPVVGIIGGRGRLGLLFADFFGEKGIEILVSDIGTKLDNKTLAKKSDIVIISVPIDITEKVIKEVLTYVKKDSAITDFTSIKTEPINAMLKGNCEVFGMHPMFGNSNPISGQSLIFCDTKKSGKWAVWMKNFLKNNDVEILEMNSEKHDKIMSVAQVFVHFSEITFGKALSDMGISPKELLKYLSKSSELRLMLAARVLDQDPILYGGIQMQNPNSKAVLSQYKKSIEELIKIIQKKDKKSFEKYFLKGRKYFGNYTRESYDETAFLIDKLMNKQKKKSHANQETPTKNHIAVLGPKYTFSDIAADKYLKETDQKLKKFFCRDVEEIFELVENGKVAKGLIPIENQLNGTVRETLDNLFFKKVHITKEVDLPIHHQLVALPRSTAKDIVTIVSHSQALNQCKKYLKEHFPNVTKEASSSTSAAVDRLLLSQDKSLAVIASKEAAEKNGLKILAKDVEDNSDNHTKFLSIEKGNYPITQPKNSEQKSRTKTSIAFYFTTNKPGSLHAVFEDFSKAKINLSKIESRPTQKLFGEYVFYLDFEADISSPQAKKVLKSIDKKVAKLKVLGSY